jgi:hypothetical protein
MLVYSGRDLASFNTGSDLSDVVENRKQPIIFAMRQPNQAGNVHGRVRPVSYTEGNAICA